MSDKHGARRTTRAEISEGLQRLGVDHGQTILVQSDLGRLAPLAGRPTETVVGGITDALGPTGTLIAPAFTHPGRLWERDISMFGPTTKPYTGALPQLLLRNPRSFRSAHPTHSFVALGRNAEQVTESHGIDSACFEPVRSVVESGGTLVVLGCSDQNPGAASAHLAQADLGLSQRHYLRLLLAVGTGETGLRSRRVLRESPGCSRGFGKAYEAYVRSRALRVGFVGPAWTVAVNAKLAYQADLELLKNDPRALNCDDPGCVSCALTRGYNKRAIVRGVFHRIRHVLSASAGFIGGGEADRVPRELL